MSQNLTFQEHLEAKRKAVAAARKALEKAKKNLDAVEGELRGWEEAAKLMSQPTGSAPPPTTSGAATGRGLSPGWRAVIAHIADEYPKYVSLAEIAVVAKQSGIDATPDTLRGHIHHYTTQRKYLERGEPGQFRATVEGAAAAGVTLSGDDDEEIPF